MNHSELVNKAKEWLYRQGCGIVFTEYHSRGTAEVPDAIGFRDQGVNSILIECKTNRKDLSKDKRKPFRKKPTEGLGNFRYYICPQGIIQVMDLPNRWGLIWVYSSGISRVLQKPLLFENTNKKAELSILYSALRRLHLRGLLSEIYDQSQLKEQCKSKFIFTKE